MMPLIEVCLERYQAPDSLAKQTPALTQAAFHHPHLAGWVRPKLRQRLRETVTNNNCLLVADHTFPNEQSCLLILIDLISSRCLRARSNGRQGARLQYYVPLIITGCHLVKQRSTAVRPAAIFAGFSEPISSDLGPLHGISQFQRR